MTEYIAHSVADTERIGADIADKLTLPSCIYLDGAMGAGKTTLCKAILAKLGYTGTVTSPTYNLIQEYEIAQGVVQHMDLYRLQDPEELEFLAIEDLWTENSLFLIEWPEKGEGALPAADFIISVHRMACESGEKRKIVLTKVV